MSVPSEIKPIYRTDTPNQAIHLYSGALEIEQEGNKAKCNGQLHFEWVPSPRIKLQVEESDQEILSQLAKISVGDAFLHLPITQHPVEVSISNDTRHIDPKGWSINLLADSNGPFIIASGADLAHVVFHLPNFHELVDVVFESDKGPRSGRAVAEFEGWQITIDTVQNYRKLENTTKEIRGYAIAHAAKLQRVDGSTFTAKQAGDLLDALFWYFSFARGLFAPPTLPVGFDITGNRAWEEWTAPRITAWQSVNSWFSDRQYVSRNLRESLSGFLTRWREPIWNDTLKMATHWYISANTNAGATDGSIILAQTGMELLAWVLLVEDVKKFTSATFENTNKYPAASKFEELLNYIGVPLLV